MIFDPPCISISKGIVQRNEICFSKVGKVIEVTLIRETRGCVLSERMKLKQSVYSLIKFVCSNNFGRNIKIILNVYYGLFYISPYFVSIQNGGKKLAKLQNCKIFFPLHFDIIISHSVRYFIPDEDATSYDYTDKITLVDVLRRTTLQTFVSCRANRRL